MNNSKKFLTALLCLLYVVDIQAQHETTTSPAIDYELWYNEPANNRGDVIPINESERPIDIDWERWSLPIGNGYMGASIFGGTSTERLQLTDKTLYIRGLWRAETQTSFGDLYLDFFHDLRTNYRRSLNLNKGIAEVSYEYQGIKYHREYFMSYPDNVLVIKLTADKPGSLSFNVRPQIAHLVPFGPLQRTDTMTIGYLSGPTQTRFSYNGREGKVFAKDDMITLRGRTEYLKLIYEAQIKVIPVNGSISARNDSNADHGTIRVENADSAVILLALGTNYRLSPQVFSAKPSEKLKGCPDPHAEISQRLTKAVQKGYDRLRATHISDFSSLTGRVQLNIGKKSPLPTDRLLTAYRQGKHDTYLEELFFHYGRYLLISSARKGTLPPTLQGVWNQYELAPWNGNYTHNINIQMNYWPAFNTNLIELFESYADYHKAYRPMAEQFASKFIKMHHPQHFSGKPGGNGWTMGTGAGAYMVGMPGGHSGPGMAAFTSKLFWEYYAFTNDRQILKETSYPAVLGVADFLSKVTTDTLGLLLASPSASPEQYAKATNRPYPTIGCAFDQQMIYENHQDAIRAAALLGDRNKNIRLFKEQSKRLDPVQIGNSGQIKEYREEQHYGDIVLEQSHRHISQLIGLYPGTLINENTPAWLDAAKVSLNRRGDVSTGWSMAHKINLWARTKEGNRAHNLVTALLANGVHENLWTTCLAVLRSPFQIDANFGGTAGIAEMLLQSHEGYIHVLPALPDAWKDGSFKGLTARGNFEVSANWKKGQLVQTEILSGQNNICILKYPNIARSVLKDADGATVKYQPIGKDKISFRTKARQTYVATDIPPYKTIAAPQELKADFNGDTVFLQWKSSKDATAYSIYRTRNNNPEYELIATGIKQPIYEYTASELKDTDYLILKVISLDQEGNESKAATICVEKE